MDGAGSHELACHWKMFQKLCTLQIGNIWHLNQKKALKHKRTPSSPFPHPEKGEKLGTLL